MKRWIYVLLASLLSIVVIHPASAIMHTPKDKFRLATNYEFTLLKRIPRTKRLLDKDDTLAFIMLAMDRSKRTYIIVRFESQKCKEWCMNAIFKKSLTNRNFLAYVWLPRKSTIGDVLKRVCDKCPAEMPLVVCC